MSEYKGIKGFQVQTRTEDPTPYAQALADNPYAGSWGSGGGNLNNAREQCLPEQALGHGQLRMPSVDTMEGPPGGAIANVEITMERLCVD